MPGRKYLEENLCPRLTTVCLIDLHKEGGRAACSRIAGEQFLSKVAIVSKGGDDRDVCVCVCRNHSHGVIGL